MGVSWRVQSSEDSCRIVEVPIEACFFPLKEDTGVHGEEKMLIKIRIMKGARDQRS